MANDDHFAELVRLVSLARGLEMSGFYNAAKLMWAAAYSAELRASNTQGIPAHREDILPQLDAAIADLRDAGLSPDVIAAMQRARAAVGADSMISAGDVGEVHVCRSCGEVVLGPSPEACPNCGAWELTFKTFPAVYYLEPLPPDQALAALESVPGILNGLLEGLSEEQMDRQPRPGEWGLRETLQHFASSQDLLAGRVVRMLAEDNPSLKSLTVSQMGGPVTLTSAQMLSAFSESRLDTVSRLKAASPDGWWRTGVHEEFGVVTVLQQASYFAKHDHNHLTQVRQILQAIGA